MEIKGLIVMSANFFLRYFARKVVFTLCVLFPIFCCELLVHFPLVFTLLTLLCLYAGTNLWRAIQRDEKKWRRYAVVAQAAAPRTTRSQPSAALVHHQVAA